MNNIPSNIPVNVPDDEDDELPEDYQHDPDDEADDEDDNIIETTLFTVERRGVVETLEGTIYADGTAILDDGTILKVFIPDLKKDEKAEK
jgi:hypothetical protein